MRGNRHFEPQDPDYEDRVRASFARQGAMGLLGARLTTLSPGHCELELDFRPELSQQHGYFHGGIVGALADTAGGYAAFTLMPADASVLTVEYKLNLMAPADGECLIARGEVLRAGKTLVITRAELYVRRGGAEHHCASMQQTLMTLGKKPDDHRIRARG